MSFERFKELSQSIQGLFLSNNQMQKQSKDEEQEYLQFGIFAVQHQSPRPEELYFR